MHLLAVALGGHQTRKKDTLEEILGAPDHDRLVAWLRQYAARRINSALDDERRSIAPHLLLDFGNRGLFGLQAPREAGGQDLATVDLVRVMAQLAAPLTGPLEL